MSALQHLIHRVLVGARIGRTLGMALLLVALLHYRSYETRPVLDRWSYPYSALLLGVLGLWLASLAGSWRAARRRDAPSGARHTMIVAFHLSVLMWGLAWCLGALDTPAHGGRMLDLNLVGSAIPAPALLEWGSLVAASLGVGITLFRRVLPPLMNPALSVAVIWSLVLLGEGMARLRAVAAPTPVGFPTHAMDLWARRYVRLNARGFRDADHPIERLPGVRRLAVIGDSFGFGFGIGRVEDRFGERLAGELSRTTGVAWEAINVCIPDRHTLQEIGLLEQALPYRPDVVVLLYVFNDIDYLHPLTVRSVLTEAPRTILQRVNPARVLFKNSYLFQEIYARVRLFWRSRLPAHQAYADTVALQTHLADLGRFVRAASSGGALVGIVPFDHTVRAEPASRRRHATFVRAAEAAALPVWPIHHAFDGIALSRLTLNALDAHPNELAHRLAATATLPQALEALRRRTRLPTGSGGDADSSR